MFKVKFDTANAAFDGSPSEVVRILAKIQDHVEGGERKGVVVDVNGNQVGTWAWTGAAS